MNLVTDNGVPADCDVLVVPGPTQSFLPAEEAMISKYLADGGKALIEVDPETDPKLQDTFLAWNVTVGDNVVIDASGMGQLIGAGPGIPLVTTFGASPITKGFTGGIGVFSARANRFDRRHFENGSRSRRAVEDFRAQLYDAEPEPEKKIAYDPKTDTIGPLSLGVAANRKVGEKTARLVVIGNSHFASNRVVNHYRNGDLFLTRSTGSRRTRI